MNNSTVGESRIVLYKKKLALSTLWNLLGLTTPLLAAALCIPALLEQLGEERFGILVLAWMIVGYFSLFDLGMGRALTQILSIKIGEDATLEIPALFWTALALMTALGLLGGAMLGLLTPLIVTELLHTPPALVHETKLSFYLLAFSLPFVVTSTGTRGALEAYQMFGLVNLVRVPMGILNYAGPLWMLQYTSSLAGVVGTLVFVRVASWVIFGVLSISVIQPISKHMVFNRTLIRPLLSFGGWMTVSNVIGPVMIYMDRMVIAGLLSLSAVTYYATPHEMVTRLGLIPSAIMGVMFPAFSTAFASNRLAIPMYFAKTAAYTALIFFPLALFVGTFSYEILAVWIKPEFAEKSGVVLLILLVGIFINGFARIPYTLLQSAGHPDITARIHLLEFVPFIVLLVALTKWLGPTGAAIAWTVRVIVDLLLLDYAVYLKCSISIRLLMESTLSVVMAGAVIALGFLIKGIALKLLFILVVLVVFAYITFAFLPVGELKQAIFDFLGKKTLKVGEKP